LSLQPRFKPALPDTAFEFLEKALHEAERAGHIIQCMRRLVERRAPVRQPGCMNSIVEDALEATLLGAPAGTRVVCDLALDLPLIPIDAVQIQQIIVNLLRNALDAVHDCKAPEICICTRHANGAVMLTVQDNGPGVSAQMASRIFQAFASEKHDGLGLGLMISKVIAHNHGGDLLLESGEKGKGAVFVLRLPVSLPGESPPLAASCAIPQKGAR
jgi:two-component system sensor kinase FixL